MARRRALAASSKRPRQSGQPALNVTGVTLLIPANAEATVMSAPDVDDSLKAPAPLLLGVRRPGATPGFEGEPCSVVGSPNELPSRPAPGCGSRTPVVRPVMRTVRL